MENIQTTVLIVHTLIALGIIALVLLQRGKGAEAGAAFGAGASGTVFGAQGSTNFFSRATAILATAFFATSLSLAYISSQRTGAPESLLESMPLTETEQQQEAMPVDEVPQLPESDIAEPQTDDIGVPPLEAEAPADEPPAEQ
jgi:preprotein translocase subunit SecG